MVEQIAFVYGWKLLSDVLITESSWPYKLCEFNNSKVCSGMVICLSDTFTGMNNMYLLYGGCLHFQFYRMPPRPKQLYRQFIWKYSVYHFSLLVLWKMKMNVPSVFEADRWTLQLYLKRYSSFYFHPENATTYGLLIHIFF